MNLPNSLARVFRRSKSAIVNIDDIFESSGKFLKNALPYKDIPGPRGLPLFGNTWKFIPFIGPYQIEHLDKVSQSLYETYGSIVKVDGIIGRPDMLFLFDPDEIENVFRQEDAMPYRPSMPSLDYYKNVYRKDFFGNDGGVIAVHGESWQRFRSKVNKIMLQPKAAKMYIRPIESTAEEFTKRIETLRDESDEVGSDFLNEIHKWSLESIARVALDVRLGCLDRDTHPDTQKLIDAVNTFFLNVPILELRTPFWRLFKNPMLYPTFKKYISALETIREICMKHVNASLKSAEEKKTGEEPSILQKLLQLDNDTKTACIFAMDMFLVGIDTTSNAVASILYQLAIHPDKQDIAYRELRKITPDQNMTLGDRKLDQMVYLKACIKETLRKYPVVIGNGRTTTKDCTIGGYHVPKGVQVIFQHCVISNTEKYFPRSDEFLPERWLKSCPFTNSDDDVGISKNHHPFASLPFGYGKRMCLGRRFADLEVQIIIAKILQLYQVEYHYDHLDYYVHPMYTPRGALKLRFKKRSELQNDHNS